MNRNAAVAPHILSPFCLLLALALAPRAAAADRPVEGLLVQVPTSITSESTGRLKSVLHGPLSRFKMGAAQQRGQFWLVLDFNPDGQRSECDDFSACLGLAKYLRALPAEVAGVSTVAYVRGDVRAHSVLPVLACSRIEMAARAKLGPIAVGGKPLDRIERTAYEDLTKGRFDPLLVRKMYDPNLEVYQAPDGRLVAGGEKLPAGSRLALEAAQEARVFDFEAARKFGLCSQAPVNSTDELRATYNLPRGGAQRHLDRTVCWRIPLEGAITGELVELTKRRVKRALQARANLIIFELKCAGGDSEKAHELGLFISGLNEGREESPVETVAYVTNQARNLAAFVAFSCHKIVMQNEPGDEAPGRDEEDVPAGEARLGGFGLYVQRHPTLEALRKKLTEANHERERRARSAELATAQAELEESLRRNLGDLAARQGYPAVLAAGMFSKDMRIHLVERAKGASGRMFLTEDELKADKGQTWRSVRLVKPWREPADDDRYLTLTARQAQEVGVADVVRDFNQLAEREGVAPGQVHSPGSDWLDGLGDFLRHPWTSVLLVMVGITCLILELKMPGVGLPGVIAAICFVLFFWAHSQLNGQITWLALLLFVLGLVLIGLEVFVLPGFGVCGISGTLLVLASLGLVAYGHWPRTGPEWASFGQKLSPFGVSLLGAVALVALAVRYLPHIPVLNRLISKPPEETEEGEAPSEPASAELESLLGAIGVAATPLRPAGKCQFQDAFVDVQSEGGFITVGTRVRVVEIEGNRVKVKQV